MDAVRSNMRDGYYKSIWAKGADKDDKLAMCYGPDRTKWPCDDGTYRTGATCSACSTTPCPVGQYRTACPYGSMADSTCAPCTGAPAGSWYTTAGAVSS